MCEAPIAWKEWPCYSQPATKSWIPFDSISTAKWSSWIWDKTEHKRRVKNRQRCYFYLDFLGRDTNGPHRDFKIEPTHLNMHSAHLTKEVTGPLNEAAVIRSLLFFAILGAWSVSEETRAVEKSWLLKVWWKILPRQPNDRFMSDY